MGVGIAPPFTNARLQLEAGYRARNFASLGYSLTDPLPDAFPRSLDLSGWQFNAGWQFDLRPLSKTVDVSGAWVLARVDGLPLPFTAKQQRTGAESVREELLAAYLDLAPGDSTYGLDIVTRRLVLLPSGAPVEQQVSESRREEGRWSSTPSGVFSLTSGDLRQRASRADDELVVEHAGTGRRLFFRRVRRS